MTTIPSSELPPLAFGELRNYTPSGIEPTFEWTKHIGPVEEIVSVRVNGKLVDLKRKKGRA